MAALNGAVPFKQMDHLSMLVSQHLHLDVARVVDALFQEHLGIAKGFADFGNHPVITAIEFIGINTATNSPAAAAIGGFQHHRVTDFFGSGQSFLHRFHIVFAAGKIGYPVMLKATNGGLSRRWGQ